MSYEADIYAVVQATSALTTLIGTRFFWDIADGSAVAPYIVAQTISDSGETDHDGDRSISFPLIQFSCWAKTKVEALAVMAAFKTAMEGVTLAGSSATSLSFAGQNSSYDRDTKLYGQIHDYRAAITT